MKLVNAFIIINLFLTASLASANYESLKLDPAIIVGHYGSGLRISENKQSLTIQNFIKDDGKYANLNAACKDLALGIRSSLDEITELSRAAELKNNFSMEISSHTEGTLSNNQKYICVVGIRSLDSKITFNRMETDFYLRDDSSALDEADLKTIKIVDELRDNTSNINYFHAKHTYFPIKSFIEYVQVQQTK